MRAYRCTRGHVTELVESLDGPTLGRCPEPTIAIKLSGDGEREVPWTCGARVERVSWALDEEVADVVYLTLGSPTGLVPREWFVDGC